MTSPLTALKSALGQPMLSERKARAAVIAVLESVREPSKAMVHSAGGAYVNLERADDQSYEPPEVWRDMLDALIAEVRGDEG